MITFLKRLSYSSSLFVLAAAIFFGGLVNKLLALVHLSDSPEGKQVANVLGTRSAHADIPDGGPGPGGPGGPGACPAGPGPGSNC